MTTRFTNSGPGLAVLLLLVAGCATPVMPSGGPPDRTPPMLVFSEPASEAVMVRTDRLLLEFSKPINEASMRRAVSIAPDFQTPLEVSVRGRRAEIVFPEPLRENTTYVVTLGTELQDLRNNRLPEPITLAFATGEQLDDGRISGWVRDPVTGRGVAEIDLFAYALDPEGTLPDPRLTAPDYRTGTDEQGRFRLEYLRDVPFFVVAIEDVNRNRRADPGEAFAAPPDPSVRPAPDGEVAPNIQLYITRIDTLAPEPLRVRPRSDRRIAIRFTEPVILAEHDPGAFAVADSSSGEGVPVLAVYPDDDPQQIILDTEPMPRTVHEVRFERPGAVRDTAGNSLSPRPLSFMPLAESDRESARIVAFEPAGTDTLRTLRPGEIAAVRFSSPPADPPARDRITVLEENGTAIPAEITSQDGVRFEITPEVLEAFSVRVRQPDSVHVMRFQPLSPDSLGDLTGRIEDPPEDLLMVIEAIGQDDYVVRTIAEENGSFAFTGLPAGAYRLRVFADRNASGEWSGGALAPYEPPELLRVVPQVRVRARWETEIEPIKLDPAEEPRRAPPPIPADEQLPDDG